MDDFFHGQLEAAEFFFERLDRAGEHDADRNV
jgi:hypothetical protein